jgi:hypothetical protein
MVHNASVVIIPADLSEGSRERVVSQDGVPSGWTWTIERAGLACGMGWHRDAGEEIICFWAGLAKYRRCVETVN